MEPETKTDGCTGVKRKAGDEKPMELPGQAAVSLNGRPLPNLGYPTYTQSSRMFPGLLSMSPFRSYREMTVGEAFLGLEKLCDVLNDEVDDKSIKRPHFPPANKENTVDKELRKIHVPNNRYTPLKDNWEKLYTPIVEHLLLQVRFNLKTRNVEIRTGPETQDPNSIQKAADFVQAFVYGFDVDDALALVRLDDLYLETFDIKDG
ncbi:pre-rRNA-processing protein pno1 [Halocaridina rubra]|uniref:Pre-rRNA-processing protein pno1 n=1 Tax=Halocaridina rubra TaxID=373956 RepID=A0AAN9A835_HALRR